MQANKIDLKNMILSQRKEEQFIGLLWYLHPMLKSFLPGIILKY